MAEEAKSSWNTVYQSREGFECQITLRDEDESELSERAESMMASITESGGAPLKRRGYVPEGNASASEGETKKGGRSDKAKKTYLDEEGVRRCNLKLKSGKVCGSPVSERQGKYGSFWSCPNYRDHAPEEE